MSPHLFLFFFFFNDTATTEIYTLSLHDALPISSLRLRACRRSKRRRPRRRPCHPPPSRLPLPTLRPPRPRPRPPSLSARSAVRASSTAPSAHGPRGSPRPSVCTSSTSPTHASKATSRAPCASRGTLPEGALFFVGHAPHPLSIIGLTGGRHMRELTARQREVLGFIQHFTVRHGVPPTVREIGDRFKVTPRAAFDHLRALERKGALQRRPSAGRTSRALTPTVPLGTRQFRPVPILGRIAAGSPNLASEDVEGELPVAPSALAGHGEDVFALRVRGESMIEAHICDGDLVLVRRQDSAQPNDIVVALLRGF